MLVTVQIAVAGEEIKMTVSFQISKGSLLCSEFTFQLYWCILCVIMEYALIIYSTFVSIQGNMS